MKKFNLNLGTLTKTIMMGAVISVSFYSCKCDKKTDAASAAGAAAAASTDSADAENGAAAEEEGKLEGGNYVYNVGADTEISLPDGTKLSVGDKSTEAKLYNRLNGDYTVPETPGADDWMVLDRVYFSSGGAELTPESKMQVENISKIMKNYPNANLKFGGYTDNTGSEAANMTVSTKRANAVMNDLIANGIEGSRLSAKGFGPKFPVCEANDTDACKAQNRRVDIRISAK